MEYGYTKEETKNTGTGVKDILALIEKLYSEELDIILSFLQENESYP